MDKIQEGYFEFIKQSNMRVLVLDTNNIDFVNSEKDYQRVVRVIDQEYPLGIHRVTF